MKRLLLLLLPLCLLSGCAEKTARPTDGLSPEAVIAAMYERCDPGIPVVTRPLDLADGAALRSFTGLTDASPLREGAVSEAAIGAQAYLVTVLRVKDAKDAPAVAAAMRQNLDPARWVCVCADDGAAAAQGDLAMAVLVSTELRDQVTAAGLADAFRQVCGGRLSYESA